MRYVQNNLDRRYQFLYYLRPFYSLATLCHQIARVGSILNQTESIIILSGWQRLHSAHCRSDNSGKFPKLHFDLSIRDKTKKTVKLISLVKWKYEKNAGMGEIPLAKSCRIHFRPRPPI